MCGATAGVGCAVAAGAIAGATTSGGFAAASQVRAGKFNPLKLGKAAAKGAAEGTVGALAGHGIGRMGGKLLNRVAAKAWAGGAKVMNGHFAKHGASMGYKSAWRYTAGAIRASLRVVESHSLKSGGVIGRTSGYRFVNTYHGRLTSFMKGNAKAWNRWLRR